MFQDKASECHSERLTVVIIVVDVDHIHLRRREFKSNTDKWHEEPLVKTEYPSQPLM